MSIRPVLHAGLASSLLSVAAGLWSPSTTSAQDPPPDASAGGDAAPAALTRAVVFPFDGTRSYARRARSTVGDAVDGIVEVVSSDELRAAIAEFEIDTDREDAAMELATVVAAPIIFTGEIEGRGRRARTVIIAKDANGEELGRREAGSPRTPSGREEIAVMARELATEATVVYEERRRAQLEAARQAEIEAARQAEIDQELLEEIDGGEGSEGDGGDDGEGPGESLYPLIQVTGGLTFRNRNVTIDRVGPDGGPVLPVEYDVPGLFPEFSLHIEARPLNGNGAIAAGLVTWLDFAVAFGLTSETAGDGQELDTSVFQVEGGVGYLYPVDIFQAGVNLAVGHESFDLEENLILPSMDYTYLRIGLDGRMRLLDGLVEPRVFFGYRIVLGVNDELTDFFGSSTTANGIDVGVGVAGVIWEGLTYLVRFDYVRWSLSFDGIPEGDRDIEDPAMRTREVGEDGTDDGIRLTIQAGWSF